MLIESFWAQNYRYLTQSYASLTTSCCSQQLELLSWLQNSHAGKPVWSIFSQFSDDLLKYEKTFVQILSDVCEPISFAFGMIIISTTVYLDIHIGTGKWLMFCTPFFYRFSIDANVIWPVGWACRPDEWHIRVHNYYYSMSNQKR